MHDSYHPHLNREMAKAFITSNKELDQPFFMYLPMMLAHGPLEDKPNDPSLPPGTDVPPDANDLFNERLGECFVFVCVCLSLCLSAVRVCVSFPFSLSLDLSLPRPLDLSLSTSLSSRATKYTRLLRTGWVSPKRETLVPVTMLQQRPCTLTQCKQCNAIGGGTHEALDRQKYAHMHAGKHMLGHSGVPL